MRISLPNTAREAMRWPGASDRMVAAILMAALIDLKIITSDDMSMAVDRNKIRREKLKAREDIQEKEIEELENSEVEGFYFDGKEVNTMEVVKTPEGFHKQVYIKVKSRIWQMNV
jgi:hypothetical protein